MNEDMIVSMATPYVKDGAITYDQFDKLFDVLSLQEKYVASEVLFKHGINLEDGGNHEEDDTDVYVLDEDEDEFEILYDENIFKDSMTSDDDYVMLHNNIKQSNEILCYQIQSGNKQAVQDLCVKNKRLVDKYVCIYQKRYSNRLDFDDLEQVGYLGLIKAAKKFDIEQGFAFSTYAVWWIKQSISREIMDNGYAIRIPVHVMEKMNRVTQEEGKLLFLPLKERIKEIAKKLGFSEKNVGEYIFLRENYLRYGSLNSVVGEDEATELGEFIPDEVNMSVEEEVALHELRKELELAMENLSDREKKVIRMRFGFDDGNPKTLEVVGREFGVTRERIRQIEAKALRRLRHPIRTKLYKDFYEE